MLENVTKLLTVNGLLEFRLEEWTVGDKENRMVLYHAGKNGGQPSPKPLVQTLCWWIPVSPTHALKDTP